MVVFNSMQKKFEGNLETQYRLTSMLMISPLNWIETILSSSKTLLKFY